MSSIDRRPFVEAKAVRQDCGAPADADIDPFAVATSLGVDVVRIPLGDGHPVDGAYLRRGGRGFILVNSSGAFRRQRMTCAHELGHHILIDDTDDVEVIEALASAKARPNPAERAAFLFASELLMPELGVRPLVADIQSPEDRVGTVANRYDVSAEAAAIRLSELGIIDPATTRATLDTILLDGVRFRARQHIPPDNRHRQERVLPPDFTRRAKALRAAGILSDERFAELVSRDPPTP